jgi:hypothetical protein
VPCCVQADEELREGKLRFRGGRSEAATYDEPDQVGAKGLRVSAICLSGPVTATCLDGGRDPWPCYTTSQMVDIAFAVVVHAGSPLR